MTSRGHTIGRCYIQGRRKNGTGAGDRQISMASQRIIEYGWRDVAKEMAGGGQRLSWAGPPPHTAPLELGSVGQAVRRERLPAKRGKARLGGPWSAAALLVLEGQTSTFHRKPVDCTSPTTPASVEGKTLPLSAAPRERSTAQYLFAACTSLGADTRVRPYPLEYPRSP